MVGWFGDMYVSVKHLFFFLSFGFCSLVTLNKKNENKPVSKICM